MLPLMPPVPSLFDPLLRDIAADEPGVIIMARYDSGRTLYSTAGLADIAAQTPVTPETIFNLASLSKQITACSVLLLAQDGKLSPDDSVRKWLPELHGIAQPVTLRHLLYHTGGLKDYIDIAIERGIDLFTPLTAAESLADIAAQSAADFPPGTRHDYSNTGYFLLAQVIERASGQRYAEFARERIFAPLGMTHSFIVESYPAPQTIATGYNRDSHGWVISESPWTQTGDGAVHASATDLMKWGAGFSTGFVGGDALRRLMTTPFSPLTDSGEAVTDYEPYGGGLCINRRAGETSYEHAGSWPGFSSYFIRLAESNLTIVVLSNRENSDTEGLAVRAAEILTAPQPHFPAVVTAHWQQEYQRGRKITAAPDFRLMRRDDLEEGYDALWLRQPQGDFIHLSASLADALKSGVTHHCSELLQWLQNQQRVWTGADQLFYLTEENRAALLKADSPASARRLIPSQDGELFARFCAQFESESAADDLDTASVELSHWRVTGVFADDRLVAVASAYPWEDSRLADIGVVTHPDYRQHGYARQAVQALCREILQAGYEPQYRCQPDNTASVQLALRCGFAPFGQWDFLFTE